MKNHSIPSHAQRGVVLIVALFMLMMISVVAAYNARSVSSGELVANNTRTTQLAMNAAEAALRYCEQGGINFYRLSVTPTLTITPIVTPTAAPVTSTYEWQTLGNWDGTTTLSTVRVLGTSLLVLSNGSDNFYKRSPECMLQYLQPANTRTMVVTSRGFGPEVAPVDAGRTAPKGSEVWLQSRIVIPN